MVLFCIYGVLVITNSPQTRLSKRLLKKKKTFGVKTAEWGRVNNDWTISDTKTVSGQQSQALEIKDILQLRERKHHVDSQTQNHTRPSTPQPGPRSIISNEMKSYFIGLPILHTAQFSKRLGLKMHQESLEGKCSAVCMAKDIIWEITSKLWLQYPWPCLIAGALLIEESH